MKIPMLEARATRDAGFARHWGLILEILPQFLPVGQFSASRSSCEAVDNSKESPPVQQLLFAQVAAFHPLETPTIYSNQLLKSDK